MSNRPLKNKKKVSVEEEELDQEHEVQYRSPGKTSKDLIIQLGVTILIVSFILAPMLVFVFSPTPAPVDQQQAQQQQQDENESQIKHYSEELAKDPNNATTLANLGYYKTQKAGRIQPTPETENLRMTLLKEAEGNLRKALETDPKYGFAQAELARNLLVQENFTEAESFINQALKTADDGLKDSDAKVAAEAQGRKAEMLSMSSMMSFQKGDTAAAIGTMDEVIKLTPGNPQLYQQRAIYHMKNNDKDAAKKDLATMVDIGQKTGDQRAVMTGQMMIEQIDAPPMEIVTPGAPGSPAAPGTPSAVATPAAPAAAPAAPSTP